MNTPKKQKTPCFICGGTDHNPLTDNRHRKVEKETVTVDTVTKVGDKIQVTPVKLTYQRDDFDRRPKTDYTYSRTCTYAYKYVNKGYISPNMSRRGVRGRSAAVNLAERMSELGDDVDDSPARSVSKRSRRGTPVTVTDRTTRAGSRSRSLVADITPHSTSRFYNSTASSPSRTYTETVTVQEETWHSNSTSRGLKSKQQKETKLKYLYGLDHYDGEFSDDNESTYISRSSYKSQSSSASSGRSIQSTISAARDKTSFKTKFTTWVTTVITVVQSWLTTIWTYVGMLLMFLTKPLLWLASKETRESCWNSIITVTTVVMETIVKISSIVWSNCCTFGGYLTSLVSRSQAQEQPELVAYDEVDTSITQTPRKTRRRAKTKTVITEEETLISSSSKSLTENTSVSDIVIAWLKYMGGILYRVGHLLLTPCFWLKSKIVGEDNLEGHSSTARTRMSTVTTTTETWESTAYKESFSSLSEQMTSWIKTVWTWVTTVVITCATTIMIPVLWVKSKILDSTSSKNESNESHTPASSTVKSTPRTGRRRARSQITTTTETETWDSQSEVGDGGMFLMLTRLIKFIFLPFLWIGKKGKELFSSWSSKNRTGVTVSETWESRYSSVSVQSDEESTVMFWFRKFTSVVSTVIEVILRPFLWLGKTLAGVIWSSNNDTVSSSAYYAESHSSSTESRVMGFSSTVGSLASTLVTTIFGWAASLVGFLASCCRHVWLWISRTSHNFLSQIVLLDVWAISRAREARKICCAILPFLFLLFLLIPLLFGLFAVYNKAPQETEPGVPVATVPPPVVIEEKTNDTSSTSWFGGWFSSSSESQSVEDKKIITEPYQQGDSSSSTSSSSDSQRAAGVVINDKELTQRIEQIIVNMNIHNTQQMSKEEIEVLMRSIVQNELGAFAAKMEEQKVEQQAVVPQSDDGQAAQLAAINLKLAEITKKSEAVEIELNNAKEAILFLQDSTKKEETQNLINGLESQLGDIRTLLGTLQAEQALFASHVREKCCKNETELIALMQAQLAAYMAGLTAGDGADISSDDTSKAGAAAFAAWLAGNYVSKEYMDQRLAGLVEKVTKQIKERDVIATQEQTAESGSWFGSGLSEEKIRIIIEEILMVFSADKTGMPDYALESAGGSIISTRCSQTFHRRTAQLSLFGLPLWYTSNSPRTVLQPDVHPGQCWAFKGQQGYLVIQLATTIRPTKFSMEHIPKSLSSTGTIDSAPKDFTVWGLTDENDYKGTLLGNFTYNANSTPLQTFAVENPREVEPYDIIELKIHSNQGNEQYTCLYRFRVHGDRVENKLNAKHDEL